MPHKRLIKAKGDRALGELYRKIAEAKQRATQLATLQSHTVDAAPKMTSDMADRFPAVKP